MPDISKRLTNSRDRIARRGGVVLAHFGREGGETTFCLMDGGGVSPHTVSKLLEAGMLKPNGDGLLPEADQTYRVVQ